MILGGIAVIAIVIIIGMAAANKIGKETTLHTIVRDGCFVYDGEYYFVKREE